MHGFYFDPTINISTDCMCSHVIAILQYLQNPLFLKEGNRLISYYIIPDPSCLENLITVIVSICSLTFHDLMIYSSPLYIRT